ncbi:MAG TPA: VCBS repeat-containing protein [Steroidobacteraceae bacterium]|nr:VCBS repeat-containing protein [Steroidobacteraceae bacterium]
MPFINQPLSPAAVAPGGAAFTLTVRGSGFAPGAQVQWNHVALATSVVSDSRLTASVAASAIAHATTAAVTVINPAPGGGRSNTVWCAVTNERPSVSLKTSMRLPAGSGAVATGDFNADGNVDLIVANEGGNSVSVFLGNGDGTFQQAVDYTVGTTPISVAVGDFNGDGKPDIVVANQGSNNVSVLLGNGDGTFQQAVDYAVGASPASVAVGDFNGDGKLDITVANQGSNSVGVLLGNGDGTFQQAVDYAVGANPISVAVGDFNGDGTLDLVVANSQLPAFSVLLGKGDGSFETATNFGTTRAAAVAVGDFNGDGKLDLVAAGGSCKSGCPILYLLLGNGDGTFQTANGFIDSTQNSASAIAIADLNGDGKLDVILSNRNSSAISVFLGTGTGRFGAPLDFEVGGIPSAAAVGDFNGDGKLDLAVSAGGGTAIILQQ